MEEALKYSIELDALPTSTLQLKAEIARWKGDTDALSKVVLEYEMMEYMYQANLYKSVLKKIENGKLKAVDLNFVPEVVEVILSDDEQLAKLREDLQVAKKEVKEAMRGSDEELTIARANAKALKVAIKNLEKAIAEKSKPTIDQAKVDELEAKISELEANYNTIIEPSELGNLLRLSDLISFLDKSLKIK